MIWLVLVGEGIVAVGISVCVSEGMAVAVNVGTAVNEGMGESIGMAKSLAIAVCVWKISTGVSPSPDLRIIFSLLPKKPPLKIKGRPIASRAVLNTTRNFRIPLCIRFQPPLSLPAGAAGFLSWVQCSWAAATMQ
jgi:hypothetical protein